MKSIVITNFLMLLFLSSLQSQRLNKYEYWFDSEISQRVGATFSSTGDYVFDLSLDVPSSLENGVHSFCFRVGNIDDKWSVPLCRPFFFIKNAGTNIRLNAYEYWFNDNISNRVSQSIGTGDSFELAAEIDVGHLDEGLNTFNYRVQDHFGDWSVVLSRFFYRKCFIPGLDNKIAAYRYWFDEKIDQTVVIDLPTPQDSLDFMADIDVPSDLTAGDHVIQFQFKDVFGKWSVALSDTFAYESPCSFSDLPSDHYAYTPIQFLCTRGIITGDGNTNFKTVRPDAFINRAEIASPTYRSLGLSDFRFVDSFPTPFNDIQEAIWYDTLVKKMSYLEYGDGISPFNKENFNFNPSGFITKAHAIKVLLEAWNIKPDTTLPTVYTDVSVNHDSYGYIAKAEEMGIIGAVDSLLCGTNMLCPNDYIRRADVFLLLYKIIQQMPNHTITADDFFSPSNYTPTNLAAAKNGHGGNFDFHTKTSFVVSDIGVPLVFGHTYNSYLAELPKEFFRVAVNDSSYFYLQPVGRGFSHSYHSYIMEINADDPQYAGLDLNRVVHVLPDGTIHIYKESGGVYTAETKGVYSELTKTGNEFTVRTKGQMVFTYFKPTGANAECPYLLQSIKDRNDNTTSLIYENTHQLGFQRLKEVVGEAQGRELKFFYHPNSDLLEKVTDPLGREVQFAYSDRKSGGNNLLLTFTDAKGQPTKYNYGTDSGTEHLLMSILLPKGNTITNEYDASRRLSQMTSGTETVQYSYDQNNSAGQGKVETTVKAMSSVSGNSMMRYNNDGNPTEIQTPRMDKIDVAYKTDDVLPESVKINSVSGSYDWDSKGNLLKASLPLGVVHEFSYNTKNDILQYTDPRKNNWNFSYSAAGNLTGVSSPRGATSYSVNSNGQVTSMTSPVDVQVNYSYDSFGNLTGTSIPTENISSSMTYDAIGRMLTSVNPNGVPTSYTYDENDNVESVHFVHTTGYSYDANDNLTKITNAKGNATDLTYDFQRDFMTEMSFGGFADKYEYFSDGKLKRHEDPSGIIFDYAYDAQQRLEQVQSTNDNVQYTYDNRNRVTAVSNSIGEIKFEYDTLDRVVKTIDFWENEVLYQYDAASNVTKITYPDGKAVDYTYANDNLLTSVKDWLNQTTQYDYRADGSLLKTTYPNGTNCQYLYDDAGRNIGLFWLKPSGDTICGYRYELDAMGQHLSEHRNEPLGIPLQVMQATNYQYDDVNRIQQAGDIDFSFDDRGTAAEKESIEYDFDDYERLTQADYGTRINAYKYDALGHRREAVRNGKETRFVLDILGMSQVLLESDAAANPEAYYVYGLGLISRIRPTGDTRYYHGDYRGSTVSMTDNNAVETHQYSYSAFGENWNSVEEDFNPFRYVGKYGVQYEGDSIYFMRARYYDSEIGRFLSEDPIWNVNLYGYGENNPVRGIDPRGTETEVVQSELTAPPNNKMYRYVYIDTEKAFVKLENETCIRMSSDGLFSCKSNDYNEYQMIDDVDEFLEPFKELGADRVEKIIPVYVEKYDETGNPLYLAGGFFASLWTRENKDITMGTLFFGYSAAHGAAKVTMSASNFEKAKVLYQVVTKFQYGQLLGNRLIK